MSYREEAAKAVLNHYFSGLKFYDNFRPTWLAGLELDRFYPDLGVGIEFQGEQHFRPVPGMHKDEAAFRRGVDNDRKKRQLMAQFGYELVAIDMLDLDEFRVKGLIQKIVNFGRQFATLKGYTIALSRLNTVRVDQPLPDMLTRRINKLSYQKNRQYFGHKRKSWWIKLLKAIF